jgi:hypothetical protein
LTHAGATVGLIVNPLAGSDMRRLNAPAGHTSNAGKLATARRVEAAALAAGATEVLVAAEVGSGVHTVAAAKRMWKQGCAVVVVLGGDGTCRDAAIGWPQAPLIALSTGTNNVFPQAIDPVAAGTAAGLVASGCIGVDVVAAPSKRLVVTVADQQYLALVDVAVIDGSTVGARAVLHAQSVRAVVAALSSPLASGLSSIAGRVAPLAADDPDAVVVRLGGDGARRVRVPLVPGSFDIVRLAGVDRLRRGDVVRFGGPAVLAFDGERDVVVGAGETISVTVDDGGPLRVDVARTMLLAAQRGLFEVREDGDGD